MKARKNHCVIMSFVYRVRVMGLLFVLLAVIGSLAPTAQAATYYVNWLGSDTSPGTSVMPFRTIKKGTSVLKPGDTLYVRSGTYAESLINAIPGGSSWSSPVIVAAYPGETVIVRPSSGAGLVNIQNAAYIIIDGLIFDGVNTTSGDLIKLTASNSTSPPAHHIRIKDCVLKNGYVSDVLITSTSHRNEFLNLDVSRAALNGTNGHGFYIGGPDNLIEGCYIHDNAKVGIQIYSSSPTANRNIIRKNNVYHNATLHSINGQSGIVLCAGDSSKVYNNIIWGNGIGIGTNWGVTNAQIFDNTIYGNTHEGISIGTVSTGTVVRNNIVYLNGAGIINYGNSTILSNNLVGNDPMFVNPTAHDFHLRVGSPAIGSGINLYSIFIDDFEDSLRQATGAWDIGAYRY